MIKKLIDEIDKISSMNKNNTILRYNQEAAWGLVLAYYYSMNTFFKQKYFISMPETTNNPVYDVMIVNINDVSDIKMVQCKSREENSYLDKTIYSSLYKRCKQNCLEYEKIVLLTKKNPPKNDGIDEWIKIQSESLNKILDAIKTGEKFYKNNPEYKYLHHELDYIFSCSLTNVVVDPYKLRVDFARQIEAYI